jgi:hypothetical protein
LKAINNKETILVILTGFTIIGLLIHNNTVIAAGVIISVLSLVSVIVEKWIVFLWLKFAHILGWVNSRILLSVVFYVFLTPLSLLKKLFSSTDSLKLKQPQNTTWVNRGHVFTKDDLEETF